MIYLKTIFESQKRQPQIIEETTGRKSKFKMDQFLIH